MSVCRILLLLSISLQCLDAAGSPSPVVTEGCEGCSCLKAADQKAAVAQRMAALPVVLAPSLVPEPPLLAPSAVLHASYDPAAPFKGAHYFRHSGTSPPLNARLIQD